MKYFLHSTDSFEDEKVSELFMHYGYEGLGLFYTALEKIAKQEKPIKTIVLKNQLKVGKKLEKCWEFMESLGILSTNNGDTFNKQLLNFSEKYKIKKEKTAEKVKQWRENQTVEENVTSYKNKCNAPKVKESKGKESKVNIDIDMSPKVDVPLIETLEEEKKESPPELAAAPPKTYQAMMETWNRFVISQTSCPAKIDGMEGKAMKSIIAYLKSASKEKTDEGVLISWEFLLGHWDKLDPFYKNNLKLSNINSNLVPIINQIKNNNAKPSQDSKQAIHERYFARQTG